MYIYNIFTAFWCPASPYNFWERCKVCNGRRILAPSFPVELLRVVQVCNSRQIQATNFPAELSGVVRSV